MPCFLGRLCVSRDNNLNLIRALAAVGVLFSHAWPIALGPGTAEPLYESTGFSLGALCVILFFAASGFLIAGSWERGPDPVRFILARALRLLPGLALSLLIVAFVMGPLVSGQTLRDYMVDPEVHSFLLRNITLLLPQYTLPGVFETNPYPAVEGSIWTLIHEVLCYGGILVAGLLGLMVPHRLPFALGAFAAVWIALAVWGGLSPRFAWLHALSLPFAMGVALWRFREQTPLSGRAALGFVGFALIVSQIDPEGAGGTLSRLFWSAALAYGTLWIAYVPSGVVRSFNRLGDYSYGIYIYAFPVQGLMIWWLGPQTPIHNAILSLPLTLTLAVFSWHTVERPAMSLLTRRKYIRTMV